MGNINSPTKAICTQLASTAISQQPTSQTVQNNLFGNTGGGGGNLFNTRPARPPATEEEKTTLKTSLSLYPIQPETPEGEAAYLDQLRTWRRTNGDNNVSKFTGFPLRPGGAPPGSGECYNCGRTGHRRIDCHATVRNSFLTKTKEVKSYYGTNAGSKFSRAKHQYDNATFMA